MVSDMDKEQVVELMTETIINLNIGLAKQKEMPQDQIDQMVEISRPQFKVVNGILYDVLKENGALA
jgi:predicted XRE-type DNA-binding protein